VLAQVPPEERQRSLDDIVATVSVYYDLSAEELSFPSKIRRIAAAKAAICYLATRRYRLPGVDVARCLGYTPSAVTRATRRGEKIIEEDAALRSTLKRPS
jgi:chromosomal replication initiation ATPase DnaA